MQLTHYTSKFEKRGFPITLICDQVSNAPNIGSLFRMADAFGVEHLMFCGDHIPMGRKMTKTSRATEKAIDFSIRPSALTELETLKTKGYYIIALEITAKSTPIHQFKIQGERPIALVVGAENFGISEAILNLADAVVHIEMFGQNSSMNVVQASNIALYEITKQLL